MMTIIRSAAHRSVIQYRARMRAQGFRQINLWVPDTRAPAFARECRRQSQLAAKSHLESKIIKALEPAATDIEDWTA